MCNSVALSELYLFCSDLLPENLLLCNRYVVKSGNIDFLIASMKHSLLSNFSIASYSF